jgi:hypothetical protein
MWSAAQPLPRVHSGQSRHRPRRRARAGRAGRAPRPADCTPPLLANSGIETPSHSSAMWKRSGPMGGRQGGPVHAPYTGSPRAGATDTRAHGVVRQPSARLAAHSRRIGLFGEARLRNPQYESGRVFARALIGPGRLVCSPTLVPVATTVDGSSSARHGGHAHTRDRSIPVGNRAGPPTVRWVRTCAPPAPDRWLDHPADRPSWSVPPTEANGKEVDQQWAQVRHHLRSRRPNSGSPTG